jgi:hypothetical protein
MKILLTIIFGIMTNNTVILIHQNASVENLNMTTSLAEQEQEINE